MADQDCYLKEYVNCSGSGKGSFTSAARLRTASISRGDSLHAQLSEDSDTRYWCHKNCVSTYTSKTLIQRQISKCSASKPPPKKRSRRSEDNVFLFQKHCFICGKTCEERDPKHPERWRPYSYCRTADRGKLQRTFKEVILDTCDQWGDQVRLRIQATVSDLHAADAKYHRDCLQTFKSLRHLDNAQIEANCDVDRAFAEVIDSMIIDKTKIWNAIELEELYYSYGGTQMSRRLLIENLSNELEPDLLVLSGIGVASILVFRSKVSIHKKLVGNSEDVIDQAIERLAKVIIRETKEIKRDQERYDTRITLEDALSSSSPTMLRLLSRLSSKLDGNLQAAMAGNMVTCAITNKPTLLQIALGVVIREKMNIELLHNLGITCSYDEVLRFKSSAAHAASKDIEKLGIACENTGLIQVVADNFDANISSPNGIKSTHALALLVTQPQPDSQTTSQEEHKIRRLKKAEMSESTIDEVSIHEYEGPKKPAMPTWAANQSPLPLAVLTSQVISVRRAREEDLQFLTDIVSVEKTPEYGGYNTRRAREQGQSIKAKTKAVYLPLIDMAPAEPTTMLTAMMEAQKLTNATGQVYTIFTNDQQLYRVAVNITWVYNDLFLNFDRYYDNSIKDITRSFRAGKDASREHHLSLLTPLPSQKVCLTVTKNKVQLINLIWLYIREPHDLLPQNGNALVVTGSLPTPMQVSDGQVQERQDLRTTHEEADVIFAQQVVHLAETGHSNIRVVADDTDVFVLLLHFYKQRQLTCNLVMMGTSLGRKCADIKATVKEHEDIIEDILPAHVLSGCDTVSALWGIGKGTVFNVLKSGKKHLNTIGITTENEASVILQSVAFIASCYGHQNETDMTALRYQVWLGKMANHRLNSAPELRVLPPTSEAFKQHVFRAHFQAAIWRSALQPDPPTLSPLKYGWMKSPTANILEPIPLPSNVSVAPNYVLKMIKCGCDSCSTARCSCRTAQVSCSEFCDCYLSGDCRNPQTVRMTSVSQEDNELSEPEDDN